LFAYAQSSTFSILPRTRLAVSVRAIQNVGPSGSFLSSGCFRTFNTRSVVMSPTGSLPMIGNAHVFRVDAHWSACFAFFHPARWSRMYSLAHCSNDTVLALARAAAASWVFRATIGSKPWSSIWRCWRALSRASASVHVSKDPKPISRASGFPAVLVWPLNRYRKIHDFAIFLLPSPVI